LGDPSAGFLCRNLREWKQGVGGRFQGRDQQGATVGATVVVAVLLVVLVALVKRSFVAVAGDCLVQSVRGCA
jgi:hypothetical protein